ncbi:vasotab-like [Haematobia irritans]|uniref:vasotab-like n=1 Tax=Haematobia irritans TaxID=7368 RepID=UPI003F4FC51A
MRFTILLFVIFTLAPVWGVRPSDRCNTACTREYNPVCGHLKDVNGRHITCNFGNLCTFNVHKCLSRQPWRHMDGPCLKQSPHCRTIG